MLWKDDRSVDDVRLALMLVGGHVVDVHLRQDDPVLQQLLEAFDGTDRPGQASFALPRADHAGFIILRSRDLLTITVDRTLASATNLPQPDSYLLINDFLLPQTHQDLLEYAQRRQSDFTPSTVTGASGQNVVDRSRRVSEVVTEFPQFQRLFLEKIRDRMAEIRQALQLDEFAVQHTECQLTAHGDGAFFNRHCDSAGRPNETRAISYVYYFFREPKGFSGGELRLFSKAAEDPIDVTPVNNAIVFFSSDTPHEVLPIAVPSRSFSDSRFTVNGWVRRTI